MDSQKLSRISAPLTVGPEIIQRVVSAGRTDDLKFESVLLNGKEIPVPAGLIPKTKVYFNKREVDAAVEVHVAKALHEWLRPLIIDEPLRMKDDAMWTWISCFPLREYALRRWCGGGGLDGQPLQGTKGLSHLISDSSIHGQARCASRRLFIAADTSMREKGDYSRLNDYFSDTDLFTTIFERQIFLRPALAGALIDRFREIEPKLSKSGDKRLVWRWIARSLNLALGSFVLEALDEDEIKAFVDSVTPFSQVPSSSSMKSSYAPTPANSIE